jgi:hypothetical protein
MFPREKSSASTTSRPSSNNRFTRWLPMNPAPPVTNVLMITSPPGCSCLVGRRRPYLGHNFTRLPARTGRARRCPCEDHQSSSSHLSHTISTHRTLSTSSTSPPKLCLRPPHSDIGPGTQVAHREGAMWIGCTWMVPMLSTPPRTSSIALLCVACRQPSGSLQGGRDILPRIGRPAPDGSPSHPPQLTDRGRHSGSVDRSNTRSFR